MLFVIVGGSGLVGLVVDLGPIALVGLVADIVWLVLNSGCWPGWLGHRPGWAGSGLGRTMVGYRATGCRPGC